MLNKAQVISRLGVLSRELKAELGAEDYRKYKAARDLAVVGRPNIQVSMNCLRSRLGSTVHCIEMHNQIASISQQHNFAARIPTIPLSSDEDTFANESHSHRSFRGNSSQVYPVEDFDFAEDLSEHSDSRTSISVVESLHGERDIADTEDTYSMVSPPRPLTKIYTPSTYASLVDPPYYVGDLALYSEHLGPHVPPVASMPHATRSESPVDTILTLSAMLIPEGADKRQLAADSYLMMDFEPYKAYKWCIGMFLIGRMDLEEFTDMAENILGNSVYLWKAHRHLSKSLPDPGEPFKGDPPKDIEAAVEDAARFMEFSARVHIKQTQPANDHGTVLQNTLETGEIFDLYLI